MSSTPMTPYVRDDVIDHMRAMSVLWRDTDKRGDAVAEHIFDDEMRDVLRRIGSRNLLAIIDQYLHTEKNCSGE